MTLISQLATRSTRTFGATLVAAATLGLAACTGEAGRPAAAVIPDNPALTPQIRQAAFIFDVNRTTGKVKITAPNGSQINARIDGKGGLSFDGRPNASIVAGDVVDLTTSNFAATGVGTGGAPAGKVNISFDVQITNKLTGVDLITPTWPTPPAGTTGALLFPFQSVTTITTGQTATGGDGTTIIIEAPSVGSVTPNSDWDNSDWNFFNDTDCNAVAPVGAPTDCYRSEPFGTVFAGATTAGRKVGFTIDPTVNQFRVRALVVADLRSATLALGKIGGTVSSTSLGGGVAGVTVSAGARSAITSASGAYLIDSVNVGSRTASITAGLPAGCTATSVSVTVAQNATSTANFPLANCTVPSGTVIGQINTTGNPTSLASLGITITPNGGGAPVTVNANAAGAFSASGVSVLSGNAGRITAFSNVPTNCTVNPAIGAGNYAYSGLTNGGTATIPTASWACTAPPITYAYTGQWVAGTADTVIYTGAINLGTRLMSGITLQIAYDQTKLKAIGGGGCTTVNVDLDSKTCSVTGTNPFIAAIFSLSAANTTGNVQLVRIKFQRLIAGASASQVTTITQASDNTLANLVPQIVVTDIPLTLP